MDKGPTQGGNRSETEAEILALRPKALAQCAPISLPPCNLNCYKSAHVGKTQDWFSWRGKNGNGSGERIRARRVVASFRSHGRRSRGKRHSPFCRSGRPENHRIEPGSCEVSRVA